MAKKVKEIMSPEPLTVDADTSIESAAHLMRASEVTDVLVTEGGKLRGLLTDSDIVVVAIAAGRHPATIPAGDCCNTDLAWVAAEDTTDLAAQMMRNHALERLPVVDSGGQLVGMVSRTDI